MSTAQLVPETWELDGDDAAAVLKEAHFVRLLVDSVKRFRSADGFSHARSLAYAMLLTIVPGIIAVVGFATVGGIGSFRDTVTDLIDDLAPGASGAFLTDALSQGAETSAENGVVPLLFGLVAMTISGVTIFGQVERGCNRIYGIEQDRPFAQKYGRALAMFGVSFLLGTSAFLAFGIFEDAHLWGPNWLRFVISGALGVIVVALCFAVIFQRSPRRHQPQVSWLVVGSFVATVLWVVSTAGLAVVWQLGDTFGDTYGQLAGVMALSVWCYLIAIGLYLGLAFAAQLEAVRAGRASPQDEEKVRESEPDGEVKSPSPGEPAPGEPAQDGPDPD